MHTERSAMEKLFATLSQQGPATVSLLTSPEFHCEIAGEGIEYCWGLTKRFFRKKLLSEKNTKAKFNDMVIESMNYIKKEHVRKFAGKARRYMLAYRNLKSEDLTYTSIEKFVKRSKSHRCTNDQDGAYIKRVWEESVNVC